VHDLDTIRRLNAEAHADRIQELQRQGKHVVALFAGLHLIRHEAYDSAEAAIAASKASLNASEHAVVYPALLPAPRGVPVFREVDGKVVEETII
jgi:hypothetical protein